jgi:hypothetical protein
VQVWYPTTIATQAREFRKTIQAYSHLSERVSWATFLPGPPECTVDNLVGDELSVHVAMDGTLYRQHVEEAAPSAQQVPIGIPGMMMHLHQAAMAHNSLLLDPMFSMTNPYAMSPWLPNLNPWAAAAAAFTPSAFTPSIFANAFAANQFLNPTAQSAYRFYPPFPP